MRRKRLLPFTSQWMAEDQDESPHCSTMLANLWALQRLQDCLPIAGGGESSGKKNKSHNRTRLRTVGLRVSVQSAKTLTEHMKIKRFQNLSQSISGPSSRLHMVFCHFELHLNVATSSNGVQPIIKHKVKLQKGSEKTPQLPMNQSTRCHSAQPQEVSHVETDLFKRLLCSTTWRRTPLSGIPGKETIPASGGTNRRTSVPTGIANKRPFRDRLVNSLKTPQPHYVHFPGDTQALRTRPPSFWSSSSLH